MKKAWIISVNMGYGHQRTAFPLESIAPEQKVININDYPGISPKDRKIWETARRFYEGVSRFKRVPLVGEFAFFLFDQSQKIFSFYPKRDLSKPNLQIKQIFSLINKGWGKDFIEKCREKGGKLPLISTFFTPAFMAEEFNYPGKIFCIICDADISRTWAPLNPKKSRIKYFAPNERVLERLKLYGIKKNNIFLTGYPLPEELVGDEKIEILKENLRHRLFNLDPQKKFLSNYQPLIKKHLGALPQKPNHPLTLMFAVGGAGAQKEIGIKIVKTLARKINNKSARRRIKVILVAGIKEKVKEYFKKNTQDLKVEIIFGKNIREYFQKFNQALKKTDILWTKPSELSFYSALGLPIIVAPAIGSQENFNKRWLLKSGFGLEQEDPSHVDEWLFDWIHQGYLAEAALEGFIEGEKLGTRKIKKIIQNQ